MRDIEQTGTEMDKQNTVYHKLVTKNKSTTLVAEHII